MTLRSQIQTVFALPLCVLIATAGLPRLALAETNIEVIGVPVGDVTFGDSSGCVNCTFHQSSQDAIVHLGDLQLDAGDSLRIHQPNATARLLTRIIGADTSYIDGNVHADGTVIFVNPAGVMFGANSVLNVGELYAVAGNMSNADFLAGDDRFTDLSGRVENLGRIHANAVALVGKYVANHGEIYVDNGAIALVAGDEAYIGQVGGHILIHLSGGADADGMLAAVENTGVLDAGSAGQVGLAAGDVLGSLAIAHSGQTRAGRIELDGGEKGIVAVTGTLDASDTTPGGVGGQIDIRGRHIGLFGAELDASGDAGGGRVRIGGDFHGAGDMPTAFETLVDDETTISADAISHGDGGEVVVWADGQTAYRGSISARGGAASGDGGFVEVSGKQTLRFHGDVDTQAPEGETGTLLLDPVNVWIRDHVIPFDGSDVAHNPFSFAGGVFGEARAPEGTIWAHQFGPVELFFSELEGLSASTDVLIEATNDITLYDLADDLLALNTTGSVDFRADADGDGFGGFNMDASDTIRVDGADVSISGATLTIGSIDTRGASGSLAGAVTLSGTSAVSVLGDVSTGGDAFKSTGGVFSQTAGTIDAGGGDIVLTHEQVGLSGALQGSEVRIEGVGTDATARVDGSVSATGDIELTNTQTLTLGTAAHMNAGGDLLARDGVGSVQLESGAHVLAAGDELRIGAITDNGNSSLALIAGGNLDVGQVRIGGELRATVDSDGDSASLLQIGDAEAGSILLSAGDAGSDGLLLEGELRATAGSVRVERFGQMALNGNADILASDRVELDQVGQLRLVGAPGSHHLLRGENGTHVDAEVSADHRTDLTLSTSGSGAISLGSAQGIGRLTLSHATDATVEGRVEAHELQLDDLSGRAAIDGSLQVLELETGFGEYEVALNGGGLIGSDTVFHNSGGVTLGDDAGDALLVLGSLDTTLGATSGAGSVRTSDREMNLGGLELQGDLTLETGDADLTIQGDVDGAHELRVNSSGRTRFQGDVGNARALAGLVTDAAGETRVAGDLRVSGGDLQIGDALHLEGDVTVETQNGAAARFQTDVSGDGSLALDGDASGSFHFERALTLAGGITQSDGAGQARFSGDVEFHADSRFDADVQLDGASLRGDATLRIGNGAADRLDISGPDSRIKLDGSGADLDVGARVSGNADLTLDVDGTSSFGASIGSLAQRFGSGTGAALEIVSSGATRILGGLFTASGISQAETAGELTLAGNADLAAGDRGSELRGDVTLDGAQIESAGELVFGNTSNDQLTLEGGSVLVRSDGEIDFHARVDGAATLVVRTPQMARFRASVGSSEALAGLGIEAGEHIEIAGGEITTSGSQLYAGRLELAGDTALTAEDDGAIMFYERVDADGSLQVEAAGLVALRDVSSVGDQRYATGDRVALSGTLRSRDGGVYIDGGTELHEASRVEAEREAHFGGAIDSAPGSEHTLEIVVNGANGQATLAGDVGAARQLAALDVAAERVELGGSELRARERIALNAGGRADIADAATVYKRAGTLHMAANEVAVGQNEKLVVGGDLHIEAERVVLPDVAATGTLRVDAPEISLLTRDPGPVALANGASVTDAGVDYVANAIDFSSVPTLVGAGQASFVTPSAGETSATLSEFLHFAIDPSGPRRLGAGDVAAGSRVLDLTARGPEESNPAMLYTTLSPAVSPGDMTSTPDANDAATNSVRELLEFLKSGDRYDDAVPETENGAWRSAPTANAATARELYAQLFAQGETERLRALLTQALEAHRHAGGSSTPDRTELGTIVDGLREGDTGLQLERISVLLESLRRLGLNAVEYEILRAELLAPIAPAGVSTEDLGEIL